MQDRIVILCILSCLLAVLSMKANDLSRHNLKFVSEDEKRTKCNCRCGERNEASRIIGGTETAVNEFPWVVRLSYIDKFYCGGTLINDRYVLTAGHCVKGLMWFMIKVTLGEHDQCQKAKRPVTRFVVRSISHNFSYHTFQDDIALLELNERVNFSETIRPVCLPHNDEYTYANKKGLVTGWGLTKELLGNQSCKLLELELPILSNEECKDTKYNPNMIADTMLCAGYAKGEKDTCKGDSGGALTYERSDKRYEVLGIVSWGIGCGQPGYPGVYTRVPKYLYWIRHNARKGCFCAD